MKYRPQQYAQALYAALEQKSDSEQKIIIKRFTELLVRHQTTHKAHAICAAYEQYTLRKNGMRNVRIEAANVVAEKVKTAIYGILGKNIYIEEILNPDLLGGIKIIIDQEIVIDASAKRQIDNLFIKSHDKEF